jgi:hypothetical protein
MGLDMYLTAKRYVSDYNDTDKALSTELMRHFPELTETQTIQEVSVRVGYWRKANAIHKWFVTNVQQGVDNCGSYSVSRDTLTELRDICVRVRDWPGGLAAEQLPTASGFFFGNTDYDEWYFQDVERTVKFIDAALLLQETENWDIEYSSSW